MNLADFGIDPDEIASLPEPLAAVRVSDLQVALGEQDLLEAFRDVAEVGLFRPVAVWPLDASDTYTEDRDQWVDAIVALEPNPTIVDSLFEGDL